MKWDSFQTSFRFWQKYFLNFNVGIASFCYILRSVGIFNSIQFNLTTCESVSQYIVHTYYAFKNIVINKMVQSIDV